MKVPSPASKYQRKKKDKVVVQPSHKYGQKKKKEDKNKTSVENRSEQSQTKENTKNTTRKKKDVKKKVQLLDTFAAFLFSFLSHTTGNRADVSMNEAQFCTSTNNNNIHRSNGSNSNTKKKVLVKLVYLKERNNLLHAAHQVCIHTKKGAVVVELAAVVWRRKHRHQLALRKELVALINDLVGTTD